MLSTSPKRRPSSFVARSGSPAPTGAAREASEGAAELRPRALLVDDSLTLQVTLKDALIAAGFAVVVCKSGEEARRALRHGPYAVIILDVMLPDASGVELAQEVRSFAATSRVPVILLSANAGILQRVSGLTSGADDFIGKACGPTYVVKRARELSQAAASPKEHRPENAAPYRILFIDDSPTFVDALAARMRLAGHDIVVASSGAAALEYLSVQHVDVIVLDLVMPELSGIEVCRRIKGTPALADIPIVVISGRDDGAALTAGSLAGVDEFIRKAEGLPVILSRLDKLLRRRLPGIAKLIPKGLPESARRPAPSEPRTEAPPPRSRKSDPPQSLVRGRTPSDPGEVTPSSRGREIAGSPLFERVVSVCGLSSFIAKSSLKRALVRAGLDEATLSGGDLARALPEIRWALSVFLPPTEIGERMESIQRLAKEASEGSLTTGEPR